jgi:hypothetical protein
LVELFITLNVLSQEVTTYTLLPSGLTDIPYGVITTAIVAVTVFVATSITDTESFIPPTFVIYAVCALQFKVESWKMKVKIEVKRISFFIILFFIIMPNIQIIRILAEILVLPVF